MSKEKLPDAVIELRNALYWTVCYCTDILRDGKQAQLDLKLGGPHRSEWPGRTPGDPEFTQKGDFLPYDGHSQFHEQWKRREIGLPRTLDCLQDDLRKFWDSWYESIDALSAMPRSILEVLDTTAGDHWQVRVRRSLNKLANWHWHTRSRKVPSLPDVDLAAMLQVLGKNDLPDLSWFFEDWRRFDDDLRALVGVEFDEGEQTGVQREEGEAKHRHATDKQSKSRNKSEEKRRRRQVLFVAALSEHHDYQNGKVKINTPIGCRELDKKAGTKNPAASRFFKEAFGSYDEYVRICTHNPKGPAKSLEMLNGDLTPKQLRLQIRGDTAQSDG